MSSDAKILFISPPYHCGVAEIAGRWLPLAFVYLAAAARQAGVDAAIYDAMTREHGYPEIEKRLRDSLPRYVASSAVTATADDSVRTLELAKKGHPATVTILGGIDPTFRFGELLASPAVDYVVRGEGEETLRELLLVLEEGGDPATVAGIAFRRGDEVIVTPPRPPVKNLDDLAAAWDLVAWEDYTYHFLPGSRLGAVGTSRGCTEGDIYSCQDLFWDRTWRGRDPEKVVAEIERLHRDYGIDVILLTDEHPTRDRERWLRILELLVAQNLPVRLLMETRVSDILRDREILPLYRQAGVIYLSIGIGATDRDRLEGGRDREKTELAKSALELLRQEGIVTEASFIVGFPDETPQTIRETMALARQLNPDTGNFLAFTPWPYAGVRPAAEPFISVRELPRYNLVDPVVQPEGMTLFQVEVALADAFRRFYMGKIMEVAAMKDDFRRRYLLTATKLFMSSPFTIKKFGMAMFGLIPGAGGGPRQKG